MHSKLVILRISGLKVSDGHRHRIIVKRSAQGGSIEVDNKYIQVEMNGRFIKYRTVRGHIFIGGTPDYLHMQDILNTGFFGCIHTLELQEARPNKMGKSVLGGKNIFSCTR